MIHHHAALRIFSEVWAEYSALVEADSHDPDVSHFILDVQAAIKAIYPGADAYAKVHDTLIDSPSRTFPATRAALGSRFLQDKLWPVNTYFHGK